MAAVALGIDVFCDDICYKDYISRNIKYPLEVRKSGHIGTVTLYAEVNEEGGVEKVLEGQAEGNSVEIKEIVIIGYQNDEVIPVAYGSRDILSAEGRRVIESFPKLEIPELYGQTIKFKLKFLIR